MRFYHLDRKNTLPIDTNKQLLPIMTNNTTEAEEFFRDTYASGISKTGERYLNVFETQASDFDSQKRISENYRIFCIEYTFEMVRLMHFQELPSRFESLFACEHKEDIIIWYDRLKSNLMDTSNATVKIIETNKSYFIGDSGWRDMPLSLRTQQGIPVKTPVFSPFAYQQWAHKYWSGVHTNNPQLEVLCRLPVTILESVPLSEFIRSIK